MGEIVPTANTFSAILLFTSGTKMAGAASLWMCSVAFRSHKRLKAYKSSLQRAASKNEMASSLAIFLGSMAQALSAFMIFKPIVPAIHSVLALARASAAHPGLGLVWAGSGLVGLLLGQIIEGLAMPH